MNSKETCVFLIRSSDSSYFLKKLEKHVGYEFDVVFCLLNNEKQNVGSNNRFIYGVRDIVSYIKKHRLSSVTFFDIFPVYVSSFIGFLNKMDISVNFIQHGDLLFKGTGAKTTLNTKLRFLFDNIFISLGLVFFLPTNKKKLIRDLFSYFLEGGVRSFEKCDRKLKINFAFVWAEENIKNLSSFGNVEFDEFVITKIPESGVDFFIPSDKGLTVYVSQPFVESGLLNFKLYWDEVNRILDSEENSIVLLHPKIDLSDVRIETERVIYLNEIREPIQVRKFVGHYSSFLFSIVDKFEFEQLDFGSEVINRFNSEFNEKIHSHISSKGVCFRQAFCEKII